MTETRASTFNPVFWLLWLLPGATVIAGFATLAIALNGADRPLPPSYHWEGERLDADFDRVRRAAARGITVLLTVRQGECVALVGNAPGDAATLELELVDGSGGTFDRRALLRRVRPGEFRAACDEAPAGRWWISVRDPASDWLVRARVAGALDIVELSGRDPGAAPS